MNKLLTCGGCGNKTLMSSRAEFERTEVYPYTNYMGNFEEGEEHTLYRIFSCPVCGNITLVESYWNDEMEERMAEEFCEEDKILYPNIVDEYLDVPTKINNAFKSAVRSRYLDFTLCMIALRRTLEMICIDKGVTEGMLGKKLKEMESKGLM